MLPFDFEAMMMKILFFIFAVTLTCLIKVQTGPANLQAYAPSAFSTESSLIAGLIP